MTADPEDPELPADRGARELVPDAFRDLDDTLARLGEHGAEVVDEVVRYEDMYRLCYIRGPEGILIGLAEQLG
mgnify:CR=1 FL=1